MPVKKRSKSVLKRIRQAGRRRLVNKKKKIKLRAAMKKVRTSKTKAEGLKALRTAQSIIDRSVQDRIVHKKTAGRFLSRLSRLVQKLK